MVQADLVIAAIEAKESDPNNLYLVAYNLLLDQSGNQSLGNSGGNSVTRRSTSGEYLSPNSGRFSSLSKSLEEMAISPPVNLRSQV